MTTENAQSQARAQMDSIHEMVAALHCDYDRLQELKDERAAWSVNWSLIGCLPDNDALTFQDEDEAREALVNELRERAAQCEESADSMECEESADTMRQHAARYEEAADNVEHDELSSVVVNGWHYWVTAAENDGLSADDYEEYQELLDAAGDCEDEDDARQRIEEDALSVEVRPDWHAPGDDEDEPAEYRILLCTGGPHVEIRGELNGGEPVSARLFCQDWFTSLDGCPLDSADRAALLAYAGVFFFGE